MIFVLIVNNDNNTQILDDYTGDKITIDSFGAAENRYYPNYEILVSF